MRSIVSGYDGIARVTLDGGTMVKEGDALRIQGAERVLVVIRIEPSGNRVVSRRKSIQAALTGLPTNYDALLMPHAVEHGEMFRRVVLDLGCENSWKRDSIEYVLADIRKNGVSAHFLEMVHAMGRYFLISTSGKYPAPLQEIWGGSWRHVGEAVLRPSRM